MEIQPHVPFPTKVYKILEMADTRSSGCSPDVVAWLPHGRAFRIIDEDKFLKDVVPMFFRQTKLKSFYRQLNSWGYKR